MTSAATACRFAFAAEASHEKIGLDQASENRRRVVLLLAIALEIAHYASARSPGDILESQAFIFLLFRVGFAAVVTYRWLKFACKFGSEADGWYLLVIAALALGVATP